MQAQAIRSELPLWVIDAAFKAGIKLREWELIKITPKTAVFEINGDTHTVYKRNAFCK
jgi:hypothetical protein